MRLIDADALANDLEHDVELDSRVLDDTTIVGSEREKIQFDKDCKQNCIWDLMNAPTIEERRKGRWILQCDKNKPLYGWHLCSECGSWIGEPANFCSVCGADMRGEKDENTKMANQAEMQRP